MKTVLRAIAAGALIYLGSTASQAATVVASGYQIKLNGKPFIVKGMNYSPVPIGTNPGVQPYGDYFVKQYDNVWKPDIDAMRAAGVNVVKLYAGNPALNAGAPGSSGNWKQFLDYCYNNGRKPIYVVMMSYIQGGVVAQGGTGLQQYISDYQKLVASTVNHPAIFGYLVGNEIYGPGVNSNPQFWTNLGQLIDAAHTAGFNEGRNPFIATATNDDYTPASSWPAIKLGEQSGKLGNLDSWMINIYRGPDFGAPSDIPFPQYLSLMQGLNKKKPMIVGEWGTPHTTRPAPNYYGQDVITPIQNLDNVKANQMGTGKPYSQARPVATFLTSAYTVIQANFSAGSNQVCAGGFLFSWCDEYWKGNNDNVQQGGPAIDFQGGSWAGSYEDEAGFGINSAVQMAKYGKVLPINRQQFKGYAAIKKLYQASSATGGELYKP